LVGEVNIEPEYRIYCRAGVNYISTGEGAGDVGRHSAGRSREMLFRVRSIEFTVMDYLKLKLVSREHPQTVYCDRIMLTSLHAQVAVQDHVNDGVNELAGTA
jgi:hypothetical protein